MRSCSTCDHYPQDNHCIGCIYDHNIGGNTKWESKNEPDVIEQKVIDDVRNEIEEEIKSVRLSAFVGSQLTGEYSNLLFDGEHRGLLKALEIIDRHIGSNDAEWKESEPLDEVVELIGKEKQNDKRKSLDFGTKDS